MRTRTVLEHVGTIAAIADRDDLTLVTDSQDRDHIRDHLGMKPDENGYYALDSFFVKAENGDYSEIYGFDGIVPGLHKPLYKITLEHSPESSPRAVTTRTKLRRVMYDMAAGQVHMSRLAPATGIVTVRRYKPTAASKLRLLWAVQDAIDAGRLHARISVYGWFATDYKV